MIFNGKKITLEINGGSHDDKIMLTIKGLPQSQKLDENKIKSELERRKSELFFNTPRKEEDKYVIKKGINNSTITENEIVVEFYNNKQNSNTYINQKGFLRPNHADYTNLLLNNETVPGGGEYSGRMTLPMCFVGSIAKQILEDKYNTTIKSRIASIYNIKDEELTHSNITLLKNIKESNFPCLTEKFKEQALELLKNIKKEKDSVGGTIETVVFNPPKGVGSPLFDGLDNYISHLIFSIPAVKGIEFGDGFALTSKKGSEIQDSFYKEDSIIKTKDNHMGGINAGVSNGMPIIVKTAIKPTPTIEKPTTSYDYIDDKEKTIEFKGMHDCFIANRAIPAIEGMIALAILDLEKWKNTKQD